MKRPFLGDIFVLVLALVIMLAALIPWQGKGGQVEITAKGKPPQVYDLNTERVLTFDGVYTNVIHIKNGQVCFEQSNCPNQTCVHSGWISKGGEAAVCTATGLVIRVVGGEIDTVIG